MPDRTHKTVSASQAAALLGESPYGTKFTLYHQFKNRVPDRQRENDRMRWGNWLQKAILKATEEAYRLTVQDNTGRRRYVRDGPIGHTRDGLFYAPDVGKTLVEAKAVDWLRWKETWTESTVPLHIEIQLQTGMAVDDARKGVVATLVGGNELKFYQRSPNREMQQQIREAAARFLEDVAQGREPDPTGTERETATLLYLYPEAVPGRVIENMSDPEVRDVLRLYRWIKGQEAFLAKLKTQTKPKLLALAEDAAMIRANSIICDISKSFVGESRAVNREVLLVARDLHVWARERWGDDVREWPNAFHKLDEALQEPSQVVRKSSVRTEFSFRTVAGDPALPGDDVVADAARKAAQSGMAA